MSQPPSPPQFVYVRPPPQAPGAVASLVCGIIGIVSSCWGVGLVLALVALHQARKARAAIASCPGVYTGEGTAAAGRVLGIVGTVLGALGVVCMIFWVAFMSWFITSPIPKILSTTMPCPTGIATPAPDTTPAGPAHRPRATPRPLGPEAP